MASTPPCGRYRRSTVRRLERLSVHAGAGLSHSLHPLTGRPDQPEYPAAGARIDYYLASRPARSKLDILDAAGQRSCAATRAKHARGEWPRRPSRRRPAVGAADQGRMNRFVWDLRYAGGPAGGGDGEAGDSAAADRWSHPARSGRG